MNYLALLFFAFAFLTCSVNTNAQKLEYDIKFQGIADNREFSPLYHRSQTILGERTTALIGTTVDEKHKLRLGLTHLFEFGTEVDYNKPQLTAYYQYSDEKKLFYFGAFPRIDLIEDFPLAILADTIQYYRPNIEGLFAKQNWKWGHQQIFIDWTALRTMEQKETFFAGISGVVNMGNFFIDNYLSLYHHALTWQSDSTEHITDNSGYNINLGYNLPENKFLEEMHIKVGVLGSAYRKRTLTNGYIYGSSLFSELYLKRNKLAFRNTMSIGNGHKLLTGDRFYMQDSYMRTDFVWHFIQHKNIKAQFNLSFHLVNWKHLDNQQQISLMYNIGK